MLGYMYVKTFFTKLSAFVNHGRGLFYTILSYYPFS